jgi:hypothetical protein
MILYYYLNTYLCNHMSQLISNDWLLNEFFAKSFSLVSPLKTLFQNESTSTSDLSTHHPSLMIEIRHYYFKAFILLSK